MSDGNPFGGGPYPGNAMPWPGETPEQTWIRGQVDHRNQQAAAWAAAQAGPQTAPPVDVPVTEPRNPDVVPESGGAQALRRTDGRQRGMWRPLRFTLKTIFVTLWLVLRFAFGPLLTVTSGLLVASIAIVMAEDRWAPVNPLVGAATAPDPDESWPAFVPFVAVLLTIGFLVYAGGRALETIDDDWQAVMLPIAVAVAVLVSLACAFVHAWLFNAGRYPSNVMLLCYPLIVIIVSGFGSLVAMYDHAVDRFRN